MITFPGLRNGKNAVLSAILAISLSGTLFAGENVWTRIGPDTGTVASLTVDPRTPSTVYACAGAGANQIFKTNDGGSNWHHLNSAPGCNIIVDPHNSGTAYALSGNKIFKTTNGGEGWIAISSLKGSVQTLLIAPGNSNTLYAGDGGSIYTSADGGATWSPILCCGPFSVLAVDPQNQDTVYATNTGGLFKSTDRGASWNFAGSGLLPWVQSLAIDPQNPNTLYAVNRGGISKSTDGGASWNPATSGLPPVPTIVTALAIHPQTPAVIYALLYTSGATGPYSNLATSTDGAASWTIATDPILASGLLRAIAPDPQDAGTLYLGTSDGVLKTTDAGGHWNLANSGLRAAGVNSVVIDSQNAGTLFAAAGGLFKSTDGGNSWFPSNVGLPSSPFGIAVTAVVADPQHSGTLYALLYGSPNGGVFRSQDGGGSWSKIWSSTDAATIVGPLLIAPQNPNVMYAVFINNRIGKSTDGGRTWTQLQNSFTAGCCGYILSLAVDPQNPNIVYVGASDDDYVGGHLWKSTDGGMSWVNLASLFGGLQYQPPVDHVVTDPDNPGTIYVTLDNGQLRKSTDGGQTWVILSNFAPIGSLVIDPQNSATLYSVGSVGSGYALFRSTDAGASWTEVDSGVRGSRLTGYIHSLTLDPQDPRTLYAGTDSGLFVITLDPQRSHRVR